MGTSRTRLGLSAAAAALAHAALIAASEPRRASPGPAPSASAHAAPHRPEDPVATRRARLLAQARTDLAAGRPTLGENLVRLRDLEREERGEASPEELASALATYRALLTDVRARVARGTSLPEAIADAVRADGRVGRYKRIHVFLEDALAHGGGNCVALSTLAAALAADSAGAEHAALRVYANHVTPDVDGFRFGMAAKCRGAGERVAVSELLGAWERARAEGSREPFALRRSEAACDDPGDVFSGVQLARTDAPPLPLSAPRAAPPASEGECRRYPLMEEHDGDMEVLGEDGRSLGGVALASAASLDLAGHAASASCFERRLEAMPGDAPESDVENFVLALADVASASEEAARVFAVAGELDVAREYEARLAEARLRAAAPLERVMVGLERSERLAEGTAPPAIVGNAGRLLALGERGRAAMVLALQKHRGYWELASLLVRPSSLEAALGEWAKKPRDVQVDVVTMLPCGSEVFRAQLEASHSARTLRAACDARLRAQTAACDAVLVDPGPDAPLLDAIVAAQRRTRCVERARPVW